MYGSPENTVAFLLKGLLTTFAIDLKAGGKFTLVTCAFSFTSEGSRYDNVVIER